MGDIQMLRERRRAKILGNSDDRMRKLLGYSSTENEIPDNRISVNACKDEGDIKSSEHISDVPLKVKSKAELRFSSNEFINRPKTTTENMAEVDNVTNAFEEERVLENEIKGLKLKFFVMLMTGAILRLMLESSMNVLVFKQNVIYQFILLQTLFVIFCQQQILKSQNINKGKDYLIMSYFLRFLGTTNKLNEAILSLYSLWRTILNDFCVFMLAFLAIHFVYSSFNI